MRRVLLVLVCLVALSGLAGAESVREAWGFRGPVKMVSQVTEWREIQFHFSPAGRLDRKTYLPFKDGTGYFEEIYDEKERVIEEWRLVDGTRRLMVRMDFNDENNKYSQSEFDLEKGIWYETKWGDLNEQGKIIAFYSNSERKELSFRFSYNESGNMTSSEMVDSIGVEMNSTFIYNEKGLVVSLTDISYARGDHPENKTERFYEYDEKGFLILEKTVGIYEERVRNDETRYEYGELDSYGNPTKLLIHEKGTKTKVEISRIAYYE